MGCACCAIALVPRGAARAAPAVVQQHLELARQAAGSDLGSYLKLGNTALAPPSAPAISLSGLINQPVPPPGQAFDNLYFVGAKWVSAWVLKTSQGLILIDALNNDDEAERVLGAGMRRMGLEPADIKLAIVTHGHGDHYGGLGYVKRFAAPKVIMSEADWTMMETKLEFDAPEWGRPPQRDGVIADGETVTLGDTTVQAFLTPGHTWGTLSLLFTVRQGGREHRALLWGGTGFNFGGRPDRLQRMHSYIDASARMRDIAQQREADVFISNHSGFDEAIDKLAASQSSGKNAFVTGVDATARALTVMNQCAQATLEAWSA